MITIGLDTLCEFRRSYLTALRLLLPTVANASMSIPLFSITRITDASLHKPTVENGLEVTDQIGRGQVRRKSKYTPGLCYDKRYVFRAKTVALDYATAAGMTHPLSDEYRYSHGYTARARLATQVVLNNQRHLRGVFNHQHHLQEQLQDNSLPGQRLDSSQDTGPYQLPVYQSDHGAYSQYNAFNPGTGQPAYVTHGGTHSNHPPQPDFANLSLASSPRTPSAQPRKLNPNLQRQQNPTESLRFGKLVRAQLPRPSGLREGRWVVPGSLDNHIFDKPGIYLVIREGLDSCIVVGVNSYGRQGVAKKCVKKSDHAIIHITAESPGPMPTEMSKGSKKKGSGMKSPAIRVVPELLADETLFELTEDSRINYGKPIGLDHYVPIEPLGEVHIDSIDNLRRHIAEIWQQPIATGASSIARARNEIYPITINDDSLVGDKLGLPDAMALPTVYKIISGTPGLVEESDPRYRRRQSDWFQPGKVIMLLSGDEQSGDLGPDEEAPITDIFAGVHVDVKAHSFGNLRRGYEDVVTKEFKRLNPGCKLPSVQPFDVESSESESSDREAVMIDRPRVFSLGRERFWDSKMERSRYAKGQRVALLVAKNALHSSPQYRSIRIKSLHYTFGKYGGEWEYALKYADHEGNFCAGQWFPENMLMAEFFSAEKDARETD
ncbi:hypothetical protein B0A55_11640 [Friedmanniomyces simplex]|uniref:DUF6590 domain-containing protein n=1 Tax=Friedmanniomyces simplex TaxID=329884 RepID=A0A4U0WEW9_9PEZI|nr:hypothetical protein B0A55_11640 [Friedmanniomyces simplex]